VFARVVAAVPGRVRGRAGASVKLDGPCPQCGHDHKRADVEWRQLTIWSEANRPGMVDVSGELPRCERCKSGPAAWGEHCERCVRGV